MLCSHIVSDSAFTVQGFFRSLFTAGFSESFLNSHHSAPDQIDLVFDDRNITRAGESALQPPVIIMLTFPQHSSMCLRTVLYSLPLITGFSECVYPGCMAAVPNCISLLASFQVLPCLCPHPSMRGSVGVRGLITTTQQLPGFSFRCWQLLPSYLFRQSLPRHFPAYSAL